MKKTLAATVRLMKREAQEAREEEELGMKQQYLLILSGEDLRDVLVDVVNLLLLHNALRQQLVLVDHVRVLVLLDSLSCQARLIQSTQ